MAKVAGPISASIDFDASVMEGRSPTAVIVDDVWDTHVRRVLGEELLREIPIAESMVSAEQIAVLAPLLQEARARGAGIREQCKIIGVPWAYRIVPLAACQEYVVTAAETLPRSVFCQTFPKDGSTEAQRNWGMLVSRAGHNAQWMAHNALALIEAAGSFQNALDVTDYIADAHEFPKTKMVHVVVKESRDWHAGRLRGCGGGRTLSGNVCIGFDLAGGEDMSAVVLRGSGGGGRSLHLNDGALDYIPVWEQPGVITGGGPLSPNTRREFLELFEQQWNHEPMIAMGAGVAGRLPGYRVVHNADGAEFSINGMRVVVDPNMPLDEIMIINRAGDDLRNHLGEAIERMMREMVEGLCVPARLLGNTDPIVYPFADGLPIRIGDTDLVLLTTWEEFQRESELMNHCVGRGTHGPRYWRRASDFEIMIGSVRRKGIETPLATIEFARDLTAVQIRGQHNHAPPPRDNDIVRSLIKDFQARIPPLERRKTWPGESHARGFRCYGGPNHGQSYVARDDREVVEIATMERIEYIGDWNRDYVPEMRPARVDRYFLTHFMNGRIQAWRHETMSVEEAAHHVEHDYVRRGGGWFNVR